MPRQGFISGLFGRRMRSLGSGGRGRWVTDLAVDEPEGLGTMAGWRARGAAIRWQCAVLPRSESRSSDELIAVAVWRGSRNSALVPTGSRCSGGVHGCLGPSFDCLHSPNSQQRLSLPTTRYPTAQPPRLRRLARRHCQLNILYFSTVYYRGISNTFPGVMTPSSRNSAPSTFGTTWQETDAASLDPASLPISKRPRAWERKPQTVVRSDGREKKVWRRYSARLAANATSQDDEEHDSRVRAVKRLQKVKPTEIENIPAAPRARKRAFKGTRFDRRKSVLPSAYIKNVHDASFS